MRKTQFFILSILASFCLLAQENPADQSSKVQLTLDEAIGIAMKDNPSLATAQARIESAIQAVRQVKADYYPSLDLHAGYTRLRDTATRPDRDYKNTDKYAVGAELTYTLFDAFQRRFRLLNAQYNQASAEEADQNARRLLIQSVSNAFYAAKLAQDNMEIAKEDANFNKILLDDAQKRKEGGVLKESDVLNFVLQVQNAEIDYITAEKNWRAANVVLGALLAVSRDDIWEHFVLVAPTGTHPEHKPFAELYEYACQNRPDLRSIEAKIGIAREGIRAAKNTWYPRLDFFADYELSRKDKIHFNHHYDRDASFGVRASWNAFNGFKTQAQIAQAEAELLASVKERDELLLEIESELRRDLLTLESSYRQLQLQETLLNTARKIRDLVKEEYTEGTATITRLNEAQTDVNNASSARSAAFIQHLNSFEAIKASTAENLDYKH
ncbi:MAG: TolC family protein [Victivallales bacterium]|nr:TolC family protein [Victivallales bacterium]